MEDLLPDQIQAFVKTRIETHPALAGLPWMSGVDAANGNDKLDSFAGGVILDDGIYPKTPGFEECVATYGLSVIAWRLGAFGLKSVANTGTANELLHIPVLIQENESVNRDATNPNATKITAERMMQYVKQAVSGFPKVRGGDSVTFTPILLWESPFEDFGVMNGLRTILVNFSKQNRINPLDE